MSEGNKMTDSLKLPGVCGLYCGACYHYRASFSDGRHLLKTAACQGRKIEGFTCNGCRSDKLYPILSSASTANACMSDFTFSYNLRYIL